MSESLQTNPLTLRLNGVFCVHKPEGMTSTDVVQKIRNSLEKQVLQGSETSGPSQTKKKRRRKPLLKVGHGGTLDPLATGCLIIGVGNGTKQMQNFLKCNKEYVAEGRLGASTDTYDVTGKIVSLLPVDATVNKDKMQQAIEKYHGEIMQIPPMYSAIRIDGVRLHDYARSGKPLPDGRTIEARKVMVHGIDLLDFKDVEKSPEGDKDGEETRPVEPKDVIGPDFKVKIKCGGGFYVRSFLHDIATDLHTGGFMTSLQRTRQGVFDLEKDAISLEDACQGEKVVEAIERCKTLLNSESK